MTRSVVVTSILVVLPALVALSIQAAPSSEAGSLAPAAAAQSQPAPFARPLFDPLPDDDTLAAMEPAKRRALLDAFVRYVEKRRRQAARTVEPGVATCLAGAPCALGKTLVEKPPCTRADDCVAYDLWREQTGRPGLEAVPAPHFVPERDVRPAAAPRDEPPQR